MIFNVTGGGGGTGCTLTITAPVGATVTVSKDGKSKPSKVATTGTVVFKGLETGTWTITITDGTDTATKTVEIKSDYSAEITFFSSTINIAYPAGLACTATDGVTTLTAPDTSGTWACVVPNAGAWTVALSNGLSESVAIANGDNVTINKWYLLKNGVANQTYKFGDGQIRSGDLVTVTPGDGVLTCTSPKSQTVGIATSVVVNLAGFTKMSVEYNGNKTIYFGGYSALNGAWDSPKKYTFGVTSTTTSGTAEAAVPEDPGELYVGVGWSAGSGSATINISNLWLEV